MTLIDGKNGINLLFVILKSYTAQYLLADELKLKQYSYCAWPLCLLQCSEFFLFWFGFFAH